MAIRYISDLHFGHSNVARYDNRPWTDPSVMDKEMIKLWNGTVDKNDTVYILGDVVWSKDPQVWKDILSQLNGTKIIIKGNHDRSDVLQKMVEWKMIQSWTQQTIVRDKDSNGKDRFVILNHSPMPFYINMHHNNTYHLFGHVHISFDYQIIKHVRRQIEELYLHPVRMYNVGCMIRGIDYIPRTLDEIIKSDAENRKFEEGHEADYLQTNKEVGHDKIGTVEKDNR